MSTKVNGCGNSWTFDSLRHGSSGPRGKNYGPSQRRVATRFREPTSHRPSNPSAIRAYRLPFCKSWRNYLFVYRCISGAFRVHFRADQARKQNSHYCPINLAKPGTRLNATLQMHDHPARPRYLFFPPFSTSVVCISSISKPQSVSFQPYGTLSM